MLTEICSEKNLIWCGTKIHLHFCGSVVLMTNKCCQTFNSKETDLRKVFS